MEPLSIVEASIEQLQNALSEGSITSVDLVAKYLRRIAQYDCRGPTLNSIPIINTKVFEEAEASDTRRASGQPVGKLEGITYTVKDSYKVKGMTVASGSPAFKDLAANEDAFTVGAIRKAGGVLIGRTNMPPMAYGGMQRGVYGRTESPYNPKYLAAAFASGSSNGSAVSTAASMAAFGMGEETVSSGRSPASNNALVAYTPSRGYISIRGNWLLYPTCDVIVPHTRTMDDMLLLLEVVTKLDECTEGDFWRDQPFIQLKKAWGGQRQAFNLRDIANFKSLTNYRFAVPQQYIGGPAPDGAAQVFTSPGVIAVWEEAKRQLEELGAEIIVVPDFPVVTAYENPTLLPEGSLRLPDDWNWSERGPLVAHGWDQFLRANEDPNIPNLETALQALESLRKQLLDDYLDRFGCDAFIFPCQEDAGAADADIDPESAAHAWSNGVFYSNGNRAFRHLGIPSVTVPMGNAAATGMPVGLTFASRAYHDEDLLRWANAFEKKTVARTSPTHTPELTTDGIQVGRSGGHFKLQRPTLTVTKLQVVSTADGAAQSNFTIINIQGIVIAYSGNEATEDERLPIVEITVNGSDISPSEICVTESTEDSSQFKFEASVLTKTPPKRDQREKTIVPVARDKHMIVILARAAPEGYPTGCLEFI